MLVGQCTNNAQVRSVLGGNLDYPLIWTADFILDTNPDGSDAYRCAARLGPRA